MLGPETERVVVGGDGRVRVLVGEQVGPLLDRGRADAGRARRGRDLRQPLHQPSGARRSAGLAQGRGQQDLGVRCQVVVDR